MGTAMLKWHKLSISTDYYTAEKPKQSPSSLKLLLSICCLAVMYHRYRQLQCNSLFDGGCAPRTAAVLKGRKSPSDMSASSTEVPLRGKALQMNSDRAQTLQAAGAEQRLAQGRVGVPPAVAAPADHFNSTRCPAWLTEYEEWHVKNRNAPGAKYLFADAHGFVGVGDHLRGYMYALRVAAGTKRVLLLRWEHPGNLTDFLLPGSRIDWTWQGTPAAALIAEDASLKRNTTEKDVYNNIAIRGTFPNATFFSHDPTNKTFLVLKTNFPACQACLMCPQVVEVKETIRLRDYDHVCMFRYLFKPSPLVEQSTDEQLQTLYPSYSSGSRLAYQAVHLRLGVMRGEPSVVNRLEEFGDP